MLFAVYPLLDITKFFDLTLFCFVTGNADMHLENFSLCDATHNLIQFSPAYDLVATRLLIPETDDPEETALALNRKRSRLQRNDSDALAKHLGLNSKQASNAYKRIATAIPGILRFVDQSFISNNKKTEFKDLIHVRCSRLQL